MIWMALLMSLPVLGLALFWIYPWRVALVPYLLLVAVSAFFDWLMMRSMHLPMATGPRKMPGSSAVVLNWSGDSGQVMWRDEIWEARTTDGTGPISGETVVIDRVSGLTLFVKRVPSSVARSDDAKK